MQIKKHVNILSLIENHVYITNFQKKANIFNEYFSNQCQIHDNGSTLFGILTKTTTNALITHITICRPQTSVTEVKHRPLRIVLGWGTKMVGKLQQELELIKSSVIINGFGMC